MWCSLRRMAGAREVGERRQCGGFAHLFASSPRRARCRGVERRRGRFGSEGAGVSCVRLAQRSRARRAGRAQRGP
ncbi:hypothetical protein X961_5829 [Burkholderia pseudomallei MSHR5613]|nr:hypothetical protein X961_5829 [Burkholderia pseudomallei MSHR5613]